MESERRSREASFIARVLLVSCTTYLWAVHVAILGQVSRDNW